MCVGIARLMEGRVASACLSLIERPQTVHTRVAVSQVAYSGENSGRIILFPVSCCVGVFEKEEEES